MKHRIRRRIARGLVFGGLLRCPLRQACDGRGYVGGNRRMLLPSGPRPVRRRNCVAPWASSGAPVAKGKNDADLVAAPIPRHDPAQGWGVLAIAQYIFKPKTCTGGHRRRPCRLPVWWRFIPNKKATAGFSDTSAAGKTIYRSRYDGYMKLNYDFYGIGNEAATQHRHPRRAGNHLLRAAQLVRRIQPSLCRVTYQRDRDQRRNRGRERSIGDDSAAGRRLGNQK